MKKSFSDFVSDLQVDLERELEHKDVLLAHCMKREADEVTCGSGSPLLHLQGQRRRFSDSGLKPRPRGRFVRRLFGERVKDAGSRGLAGSVG